MSKASYDVYILCDSESYNRTRSYVSFGIIFSCWPFPTVCIFVPMELVFANLVGGDGSVENAMNEKTDMVG